MNWPTHVLRVLFGLLFVLVTYLSVAPNPPDATSGNPLTWWLSARLFGDLAYADKVGHFMAYAALSGVFVLARFTKGVNTAVAAIGLALYGGVLELVQGGVMSRSMEMLDALANALGALGAYPGALVLLELTRRVTKPSGVLSEGVGLETALDRPSEGS